MRRSSTWALLGSISLLLASCASTDLVSTWKEPSTERLAFRKVIALAVTKDESVRRTMEDTMVKRMKAAEPAYETIPTRDLETPEKVKAAIRSSGADGLVMVRVIGTTTEISHQPGNYQWKPTSSPYLWDGWGGSWYAVYDPGVEVKERFVVVEVNVYSIESGKLLWASRSRTAEPRSMNALVESIADANAEAMKKAGLL